METIINTSLRTVFAYFLLLLGARLMGRKMMSQMTFFDFVVGVTVGTIAGTIATGAKANSSIAANVLIVLTLLTLIVDYFRLKHFKFRKLTNSEPIVLIQNGKIIEKNMKQARFTIDDLMMQLREKNVFNIANVEFAIAESNGKLSVLPKSQKQPLTPSHLGLSTDYKGLTKDVIIDGNIMVENLEDADLDKQWLLNQLKQHNINDPEEVFYAGLDTNGNLYFSKKDNTENKEKHGKYGVE